MATSFNFTNINIIHCRGWSPPMPAKQNFTVSERFRRSIRRNPRGHRVSLLGTVSFVGAADFLNSKPSISNAAVSGHNVDFPEVVKYIKLDVSDSDSSGAASSLIQSMLLADIDPATAKLAIGIIGPVLSAFSFLFILRIVMSWYPKIPLGKFPYVLVYAPTEPFLIPTRKLIPPLAGVDITPVVWVGLVNFLNEILVGPQGLLVLVSQQVSS